MHRLYIFKSLLKLYQKGEIKLSNQLIDDYPILVLPKLAEKIGLNEAIILQQIHYWLKDSKHKYDNKIGFIILFQNGKTISILVSNNNKKNYL